MVRSAGIEPTTHKLKVCCSTNWAMSVYWWDLQDLNLWQLGYEPRVLTNWTKVPCKHGVPVDGIEPSFPNECGGVSFLSHVVSPCLDGIIVSCLQSQPRKTNPPFPVTLASRNLGSQKIYKSLIRPTLSLQLINARIWRFYFISSVHLLASVRNVVSSDRIYCHFCVSTSSFL